MTAQRATNCTKSTNLAGPFVSFVPSVARAAERAHA
jgi:hypothetical protein